MVVSNGIHPVSTRGAVDALGHARRETWRVCILSWEGFRNITFFLGLNESVFQSHFIIHPASRGVAARTAGLVRSVRGAKGGFPPWGLPKLRIFTSPPPVGAPQAREFSLFPPVGAPQAREFSLFPPVGAPQAREFSLFPPVGAPQAREFSLFPPVGASQAREFSLFPAVTASQAMEFSLFPPLEALQAAEFQIARQRRLDSPPNPVFFECVSMFLQWFPSKHGTLHFCRHKTGRKHHVRQCFQFPYLPNR